MTTAGKARAEMAAPDEAAPGQAGAAMAARARAGALAPLPTGDGRQTLIFDGDDTLWENNVHFERAIERFIDFAVRPGLDRAALRATLDEIERRNCAAYGYGLGAFARSLHECLALTCGEAVQAARGAEVIRRLCAEIDAAPLTLITGVAGTLAELSQRHTLYLLTKGHEAEQSAKIARSGLAGLFQETIIVPEKATEVYASVVRSRGIDPRRTWMIGNSPRSDILPARAAGLGAVLVPHPVTWSLELAAVPPPGDHLLVVEPFARLTDHF